MVKGFCLFLCTVVLLVSIPIAFSQIVILPSAKNAQVTPYKGNYNDQFNFSVQVRFFDSLDIRLLVYNPTTHVFEAKDVKNYDTPGKWKLISWNLSFSSDFEENMLSYKFEYKYPGETEWRVLKVKDNETLRSVFPGPKILTTQPQVYVFEGYASPTVVNRSESITYTACVSADREIEVELDIYNPILQTWTVGGIKTYKNVGQIENISWTLNPFENLKFIGVKESKFMFKLYYLGNVINASQIYTYPKVYGISFENESVSPLKGRGGDYFTYMVTVKNASVNDINKIHLEVWDPKNLKWVDMGVCNKSNTTPNGFSLTWNVSLFDSSYGGLSKYRFKYSGLVWPEIPKEGPRLIPNISISISFSPDTIVYRLFDDKFTTTKINLSIDSPTEVHIKVYSRDPVTNNLKRLWEGEVRGNISFEAPLLDPISKDKIKDYIGKKVNILVYYGEGRSNEIIGPEFLAAFDNPRFPNEVFYLDNFTFRIDMIASKKLNVTLVALEYSNGTLKERMDGICSNPQKYNNPSSWSTLTWNCQALYFWESFKFKVD